MDTICQYLKNPQEGRQGMHSICKIFNALMALQRAPRIGFKGWR